MTNKVLIGFVNHSIFRMDEYLQKINECFAELKEEDIWKKPNKNSNSFGNIIVHLCGNITQYIVAGLGGTRDVRERDLEFTINGGLNKSELMGLLSETVSTANDIIRMMDEKQAEKNVKIQAYNLDGIGIVYHVVEHFSYHTGQLVFWTKLLKNKDMGFYKDVDLNRKN